MHRPIRRLGLLAGLVLALAARAGTPLAPTSPFTPPDSAGQSGAAENTPLELRGIMADGGGFRYSIYDPAKKASQWVRLNEPGHDFTVRTHDVAKDTVTLDYQGRVLTLPLHTSKVVGLAIVTPPANEPPAASNGPRPVPGATGVGPVPKPPSPEETARYNRAIEEINRRRALRTTGPTPPPK